MAMLNFKSRFLGTVFFDLLRIFSFHQNSSQVFFLNFTQALLNMLPLLDFFLYILEHDIKLLWFLFTEYLCQVQTLIIMEQNDQRDVLNITQGIKLYSSVDIMFGISASTTYFNNQFSFFLFKHFKQLQGVYLPRLFVLDGLLTIFRIKMT